MPRKFVSNPVMAGILVSFVGLSYYWSMHAVGSTDLEREVRATLRGGTAKVPRFLRHRQSPWTHVCATSSFYPQTSSASTQARVCFADTDNAQILPQVQLEVERQQRAAAQQRGE